MSSEFYRRGIIMNSMNRVNTMVSSGFFSRSPVSVSSICVQPPVVLFHGIDNSLSEWFSFKVTNEESLLTTFLSER